MFLSPSGPSYLNYKSTMSVWIRGSVNGNGLAFQSLRGSDTQVHHGVHAKIQCCSHHQPARALKSKDWEQLRKSCIADSDSGLMKAH
jgi:hypothetical protein